MMAPQNVVTANVHVEYNAGGIAEGDIIVMRDKKFYVYDDAKKQADVQATGVCLTPRNEAAGPVAVCVRGAITANYTIKTEKVADKIEIGTNKCILGRLVSKCVTNTEARFATVTQKCCRIYVGPEI